MTVWLKKVKVHSWFNPSSSDPNKLYETVLWDDCSLSCNCPGWTRHVNADGSRSCKHLNMADRAMVDKL